MHPQALRDLIDHLSPQAAFWRSLDPAAVWDLTTMLLADVVDELRRLRWQFVRANFKTAGPRPKPIPRPGVDAETETTVLGAAHGFDSLAEFDTWYAANSATGRSRAPQS